MLSCSPVVAPCSVVTSPREACPQHCSNTSRARPAVTCLGSWGATVSTSSALPTSEVNRRGGLYPNQPPLVEFRLQPLPMAGRITVIPAPDLPCRHGRALTNPAPCQSLDPSPCRGTLPSQGALPTQGTAPSTRRMRSWISCATPTARGAPWRPGWSCSMQTRAACR